MRKHVNCNSVGHLFCSSSRYVHNCREDLRYVKSFVGGRSVHTVQYSCKTMSEAQTEHTIQCAGSAENELHLFEVSHPL